MDLNPRGIAPFQFSRLVPSAARPTLHVGTYDVLVLYNMNRHICQASGRKPTTFASEQVSTWSSIHGMNPIRHERPLEIVFHIYTHFQFMDPALPG